MLAKKLFSGKTLIALVTLYILTALLLYYSPKPSKIPDKLFFYTTQQLNNMLKSYSQQDIANYLSTMRLDFLYPLVYSSLLFVIINFLRQKLNYNKISLWTYTPFVALIFDFAENICIRHILKHGLSVVTLPCSLTRFLTLFKWTVIFISIAVILFLFGKFLHLKLSKKIVIL